MPQLDLKAKRKPSRKSAGADYSSHLLGLYIIFVLSVTLWYMWPRESAKTASTQRQLQHLASQNPEAEVFDLGVNEKKK